MRKTPNFKYMQPKGNKSIVVIGNGPSLNDIDMSLLKDVDTISFNRAYIAYEEWGFYPTYYMTIDKAGLGSYGNDIIELIKTSPIKHFFLMKQNTYDYKNVISAGDNTSLLIENQKLNYHFLEVEPFNSTNIPKNIQVPTSGSVTISSLAILHAMGYKNIYLVGCDARYGTEHIGKLISKSNNDSDHFRPDYFGTNIEFGGPQKHAYLDRWNQFPFTSSLCPINIISCTKNSELHKFGYKYEDINTVITKIKEAK